ncbi:MAG: hypothetical protein GX981_08815 [Tissierellia bacterium]|nr:hypothetical protein [Tissierellia bacterium]
MIKFLISAILILLSKIFMALWVYKDAKSRGIDPVIWTLLILFFSGSLIFLLYTLIIRKERNIICENCNFIQSDNLIYCGRCGNKMKIDRHDELDNNQGNKTFLAIGIILLISSIAIGSVFIYETISKDIDNIPISLMSVRTKYNDKWKESFRYKNGENTHKFKIKDKTILNCSWNIESGSIEVKLYDGDKQIREFNSNDNPDYNELIDLSDYKGSKITLKLKAKKALGKIHFFLE